MAKINLKANAKISLKLEETKKAENNKLRAQGVDIDANLRPDVVEAIALRLVERIKLIVEDGEMLYVLTSQSLRIDEESFASVTGRGNGTRLITDVNGGSVTGTILKSNYGWECKESLWTSTSACNMNRVEKRVHQLMYEDGRSMDQKRCGRCQTGQDGESARILALDYSWAQCWPQFCCPASTHTPTHLDKV